MRGYDVARERAYRRGYVTGYRSALTEATILVESHGMEPADAMETCYEHAGEGLRQWADRDLDLDVAAPAVREIGW